MSLGMQTTQDRYLYGPIADNLLLGGGSIIALLFLALFMQPTQSQYEATASVFLALSAFINYPHFAQSYMLFYENYKQKVQGINIPQSLRIRYFLYGILVPIILAAYFCFFLMNPNPDLLIFSIYAMAFFVGWHYVKQGYGMIILDSVLKKSFFTATEKKIFLVNAYTGWLSSFMLIATTKISYTNMFGLTYQKIHLPYADNLQFFAIAAITCTTLPTLVVMIRKLLAQGVESPICGMIAYMTSIYIWLFVAQMNPFFLLVIPAFHSLQYSTVVSKYILNKYQDTNETAPARPLLSLNIRVNHLKLIKFYVFSILLGLAGFWGASYIFTPLVTPFKGLDGVNVFIIMTTVFINIHHYFLDNVLWRKENTTVKKYLFK
jgi:hypothetical protein